MYVGNYNITTTGPDDYEHREKDPLGPMFFTMHMMTMVLIYFGNILTIVAVAKFESLRTVTNMFTVSLSISDLLMAIIMPYCCILNHTLAITNKPQLHIACLTCTTFKAISKMTSLFNLMAVAIDRYIAIFYPMKYILIMKRRRAGLIISALWIYQIGFCLLFIWGFSVWHTGRYCSLIKVVPPEIFIGFYLTNILICITVAITLHAKIFHVARKRANEINNQTFAINPNIARKDNRITRMTALVLGTFLICWIIYAILNIIRSQYENAPLPLDILYKLSLSLLYCNSFMNPIIYGWKNRTFRVAFKRLLSISN